LSRLLHRDLSNPEHLTNVHFHHQLPYPQNQKSFFSLARNGPQIEPLDLSLHKPIPLETFLTKKLRWATLGGQYDWTAKEYPSTPPPAFPPDIAKLLETLFPAMKAEAAIVNLYSPGDVLSMHRDVAENSDKGLISISIGCDAIFVIGLGPDSSQEVNEEPNSIAVETKPPLVIRLRSGDAVFMGGKSRFAWHGVPRIIANTCPDFLKDWPACDRDENEDYEQWRGWMSNKRINLNVRQMWD
jgi:alkylated DNA repair protein alkB family protein 1